MATITKTPAGTWKAIVRKRGWPTTIKTFRLKRDAQDWARRTEDEMVRGVYIDRAPSARLTLKAALTRYLAEVSPTKSPGTERRERVRAQPLIESLGAFSLGAITPELVARFCDTRLTEGKSNNTIRLELALLSHLYTVAIQEWQAGLPSNPVTNVRKPSPGQGRNRRLNWDEMRRLLKACRDLSNPMLGWMVRIAVRTCMRAGEIVSLRTSQVHLDRRVIRLTKTKNGSARTVPLSRKAIAVFQQALGHPARPVGTDLIFFGEPGRDGRRRPYQYHVAWRNVLTFAGIDDLHFHDLRHEAVSRLVEAGLSDQEVAAISGHKSMQMLRRYTHLRAEDLAAKLDQVRR